MEVVCDRCGDLFRDRDIHIVPIKKDVIFLCNTCFDRYFEEQMKLNPDEPENEV